MGKKAGSGAGAPCTVEARMKADVGVINLLAFVGLGVGQNTWAAEWPREMSNLTRPGRSASVCKSRGSPSTHFGLQPLPVLDARLRAWWVTCVWSGVTEENMAFGKMTAASK